MQTTNAGHQAAARSPSKVSPEGPNGPLKVIAAGGECLKNEK